MTPTKHLLYLFVIGVSLGSAVLLRGRLLDERRVLGLDPQIGDVAVDPLARSLAERQVVLASAALGVVRPLAIDFLWLRAIHLQTNMNFFEAATLAGLITLLQPRLPEVWRFQAHNLAYNLSATFPPRARFPWVLRGIKLLRDAGLRYNPESDLLALDLARIFQHKIGLDDDDAGYLYRNELARIFEVDPESPRGRDVYREWKLDQEFIRHLDEKYGVTFDFRAAEAHGIYWSEHGLDRLQAGRERQGREVSHHQLTNVGRFSMWQLFNSGRPLKAPWAQNRSEGVSVKYAFVPDLRFSNGTRRALEEHATVHADAARAYQDFLKRDVLYRFLLLGENVARARLEATGNRMQPRAPALEKLLVQFQWPADGSKKSALVKLADYLDAYLLLELAGESDFAEGFRALARLVHSALPVATTGDAPAPFDAYVRSAALRRIEDWRKQPRLRTHLAPLLTAFPQTGSVSLALPETRELPFSLEYLNPSTLTMP
jgi:hypothetical protein